ncbi:MAG: PQQ-dependent sugar dehydrogenase [Balneolaceae bacterium]|nr:PQQ-dependent sugar dehydrogenase [Balneolaceae bacterium]
MTNKIHLFILSAFVVISSPLLAQNTTNDPFPDPINAEEGLVIVDVAEFASLPDYNDEPARMMILIDEPGTSRMFVNDMYGPIYSISYDGSEVKLYININDTEWGIEVEYGGRERGFQSFAFHPDFGREGAAGYGRFYTFTDVPNEETEIDFGTDDGNFTHQTVLHEWRAEDSAAARYDGGPPRELMRFQQPFGNHNAGQLAFYPLAEPGDDEYGYLYIGSADGGSGGDPLNLSLDLNSAFGKMLRIDPLGSNSENGKYGIPADNPFVGQDGALGEIYAYGMRNPQRFGWDPANGNLFMADIGQNIVEKVSLVPKGGNLGWNEWEGSYHFISRSEVVLDDPRSDPDVVYPVAEYGRYDPLMANRVAVTGVHVYRSGPVSQLMDKVLFGDMVNGEIFWFDADNLPEGGNQGFHRILLRDHSGEPKTFLELIQGKNREQGREEASRTDLRFGNGPDDQFFLLNKQDGTVRLLMSE